MYSVKQKKEVINYVSKTGCSLCYAEKKFNIPRESIRCWIIKHKKHGTKALKHSEKYRKYTGKFKVDAVEYMHKHHYSLKKTCLHFNISSTDSLKEWAFVYKYKGKDILLKGNHMKNKKTANIENKSREELLEEIEQLRMENAYLKKLRALVQARTKPNSGKK